MPQIHITKAVNVPDPLRLQLYRRAPELGPKLLFFSGGSALRVVSHHLVQYTHNSIHLITPFDSGGSSAVLRKAFKMLAVGDLRNRLMALADRSVQGHPEIIELFAFRFPEDGNLAELKIWLQRMVDGQDDMVRRVSEPMQKLVRSHLYFFLKRMPSDFDLRGASVGNLLLAGGFLNYNRHIDPVVFMFSKLVEVKGLVRPVAGECMHLAARLEDGRTIVGQHLLAGQEALPIDSPVVELFLTHNEDSAERQELQVRSKVADIIKDADVICYPMGSFYSSLVACLLPKGVGQTIANVDIPKVYVPNAGADPEQYGMTVADSVEKLVWYLNKSCFQEYPIERLLNYIVIDKKYITMPLGDLDKVRKLGVQVIEAELGDEETELLCAKRVVEMLLSFA